MECSRTKIHNKKMFSECCLVSPFLPYFSLAGATLLRRTVDVFGRTKWIIHFCNQEMKITVMKNHYLVSLFTSIFSKIIIEDINASQHMEEKKLLTSVAKTGIFDLLFRLKLKFSYSQFIPFSNNTYHSFKFKVSE